MQFKKEHIKNNEELHLVTDIPENYFENLEASVLQKVGLESKPKPTIFSLPFWQIAASVLVLISVGLGYSSLNKVTNEISSEEYMELMWLSADELTISESISEEVSYTPELDYYATSERLIEDNISEFLIAEQLNLE